MHLGYAILFVPDVAAAVDFYERAFGVQRLMVTPMFAQMQTGTTSLAFGAEANESKELPIPFRPNTLASDPAGFQVSFISDNVEGSFARAVEAGAMPVIQPHRMPWGQTVSRVRDLNGVLVSLVSPFQPKPPGA